MLFGLVIASFGGYMLFTEWKEPVDFPRIERAAIKTKVDLSALQRCVRDGKQLQGRDCRTPEDDARDAAADEQLHSEMVAQLESDKRSRMSRQAMTGGVGVVLVALGIALDIWRSRRDRADG